VVVLGATAGDGWVESLEPVAAVIGAELVDCSCPSFVCKACGMEHVRTEDTGDLYAEAERGACVSRARTIQRCDAE
jgi:hypothetical protein